MLGNSSQHIGQPRLRIDIVEATGLDQRIDDGGALPAAIRAAEWPRLPAQRHTAQRTFGSVVGQANSAVSEEPGEGIPAPQHVVDRLGQIMMARQLRQLRGQGLATSLDEAAGNPGAFKS